MGSRDGVVLPEVVRTDKCTVEVVQFIHNLCMRRRRIDNLAGTNILYESFLPCLTVVSFVPDMRNTRLSFMYAVSSMSPFAAACLAMLTSFATSIDRGVLKQVVRAVLRDAWAQ